MPVCRLNRRELLLPTYGGRERDLALTKLQVTLPLDDLNRGNYIDLLEPDDGRMVSLYRYYDAPGRGALSVYR